MTLRITYANGRIVTVRCLDETDARETEKLLKRNKSVMKVEVSA